MIIARTCELGLIKKTLQIVAEEEDGRLNEARNQLLLIPKSQRDLFDLFNNCLAGDVFKVALGGLARFMGEDNFKHIVNQQQFDAQQECIKSQMFKNNAFNKLTTLYQETRMSERKKSFIASLINVI